MTYPLKICSEDRYSNKELCQLADGDGSVFTFQNVPLHLGVSSPAITSIFLVGDNATATFTMSRRPNNQIEVTGQMDGVALPTSTGLANPIATTILPGVYPDIAQFETMNPSPIRSAKVVSIVNDAGGIAGLGSVDFFGLGVGNGVAVVFNKFVAATNLSGDFAPSAGTGFSDFEEYFKLR